MIFHKRKRRHQNAFLRDAVTRTDFLSVLPLPLPPLYVYLIRSCPHTHAHTTNPTKLVTSTCIFAIPILSSV